MNKSNVVHSVYVFLVLIVIVMITGCASTRETTPRAGSQGRQYEQQPVSSQVLLPNPSEKRESWQRARDSMRTPDYAEQTAEQIVATVPVIQPMRQSVLTALTNMEPGSWVLIHRGDLPIVNLVPTPQSGLLVRRLPGNASEARYEAWNWKKGEPCPAQLLVLSQ